MFKRVFYTDSGNFAPTEGAETACAFATADLPPRSSRPADLAPAAVRVNRRTCGPSDGAVRVFGSQR